MKMLVSVIIAAYNVEGYILRCLQSLQSQSHEDWEAIVVDDCSSDATVLRAKAIAECDARVKVILMAHNGGPSAARNLGLRHATGHFLAILDADDAFDSRRLERLVDVMQNNKADLVCDNLLFYDDIAKQTTNSAFPVPFSPDNPVKKLTADMVLISEHPRKTFRLGFLKPMFRTSFLKNTDLEYNVEFRLAEDFLLLMTALLRGGNAFLVFQPGYIYTTQVGEVSGMQSSGTRTLVRYEDRVKIADRLILEAGGSVDKDTRTLLRKYKRWMKDAVKIADITAAKSASMPKAAMLLVSNPRIAWRYISTSSRFKRIFGGG